MKKDPLTDLEQKLHEVPLPDLSADFAAMLEQQIIASYAAGQRKRRWGYLRAGVAAMLILSCGLWVLLTMNDAASPYGDKRMASLNLEENTRFVSAQFLEASDEGHLYKARYEHEMSYQSGGFRLGVCVPVEQDILITHEEI